MPECGEKERINSGNVQKDNFVEVWENKFEFFRSETRCQSKKCKTCKDWESCREIVCIHGILRKRTFFLYKRLYGGYFYSKSFRWN